MQLPVSPDAGDRVLQKEGQMIFLPNFVFGTAYPYVIHPETFKIV